MLNHCLFIYTPANSNDYLKKENFLPSYTIEKRTLDTIERQKK